MDFGSGLDTFGKKAAPVVTTNERLARSFKTLATGAGGVALFGAALTDVDDKLGVSNASMGALIGLFAGPWGAALGAGAGAALDAAQANDSLDQSLRNVRESLRAVPSDIPRLTSELDVAREKFAAFEESFGLDDGSGFGETLLKSFKPGAMKNTLEGWFGSSDVEERAAELRALGVEIEGLVQQQQDLGRALAGGDARALSQQADTAGVDATAAAFREAALSADEFRASVLAVNEVLSGRASVRAFEQSVDDFAESLRDAGGANRDFVNAARDGFRTGTQGGRDLEAALDGIAASSLGAAESMKGFARTKFLDQARDDFTTAARAAGLTRRAAAALADELGLVDRIKAEPEIREKGGRETRRSIDQTKDAFDDLDRKNGGPTVKESGSDQSRGKIITVQDAFRVMDRMNGGPTITANVGQALGAIATLRYQMSQVQSKTVTIAVRRVGGVAPISGGMADGGPVYGPGGPRDDLIHARLSNGEYVTKAAAVDRYGVGFFDAVNAMRFADGGLVERALTARGVAAPAPVVTVNSPPAMVSATAAFSPGQVDLLGRMVGQSVRSALREAARETLIGAMT